MIGLSEHPLRHRLHNEVHARPPIALEPPVRVAYLAMLSPREAGELELRHLSELTAGHVVPSPQPETNHYSADLGSYRFNWERHAEFARYTFIQGSSGEVPFQASVLNTLPEEWLEKLPGSVITATEVAIVPGPLPSDLEGLAGKYFADNMLVASSLSGGNACAFADFQIRDDGMSRLLIYDLGMRPLEAGQAVQRLLEIDTYRMMALLALPGAQALRPFLDKSERELAALTASMATSDKAGDPELLDRLTRLEGEIQKRHADNHYRLSAADAYCGIVDRRIGELREVRVGSFPTIREFMERRLVPAMNTCRSVSASAHQLSERIARCTALLSTRVGIARENQNRQLLQTMARRAKLQLRLQQTVEGLSIAAISYYIVGLVGYIAKALKAAGLGISPALVMGLSVPVVLFIVAFGLARIRRWLKLGGTESG